ncbi:hypothetical protein NQ318_005995 [Aromia moschata]|uniref:Uncharacterized protein n=1 Tax=Aromia moschata TaxID=1265417 RepID=A0AAV8X1X3_9CUCU|nr:hypothetical protein NQ318_005995 [Aromia moschata]
MGSRRGGCCNRGSPEERKEDSGGPSATRWRGAHVLGAQSPMSLAMPFIDNDLLWSSDHDGKMVDLSSCLQDASVAIGQQNVATGTSGGGLGELSQSDLSSLVPPLPEGQMADTEDIFKHLSDTTAIEIESILSEFSQTPYIKVMLEMKKYTMAAANPILAEKLSTPSDQTIQPHATNGRPQLAPLTPKIEKAEAPMEIGEGGDILPSNIGRGSDETRFAKNIVALGLSCNIITNGQKAVVLQTCHIVRKVLG